MDSEIWKLVNKYTDEILKLKERIIEYNVEAMSCVHPSAAVYYIKQVCFCEGSIGTYETVIKDLKFTIDINNNKE